MKAILDVWVFGLIALTVAPVAPAADQRAVPEEAAWRLGWPALQGPYGNFIAPRTGAVLVDDLKNARMVWESGDKDFGRAKHTTGAFKAKDAAGGAAKVRAILGPNAVATPGGWAAPIIADGKLFATSFRPAGKLYEVKTLYDGTAEAHLEAEDLVIALDAKTGGTLWKAAEPGGFVWGVGKRQGFQVGPVYHAGTVYSMGTTGRIFAYKANDGEKLWETAAEPRMIAERDKHLARPNVRQASSGYGWQQSLVFAGDTLVVPRRTALWGLDPATGKRTWELTNVISRWATPSPWRHGEKDYLLCATQDKPGQAKLHLIDPKPGKIVWTVRGLHATAFTLSPSERHVLVNVGSSIIKENPNGSAPRDAEGRAPFGLLGAYRISPEGAKREWSFPDEPHFLIPTWSDTCARPRVLIRDGLVYCTTEGPDKETDRRFIVARLETGEVLVDEPRENDFWFQLIEDRLLHSPDWAHGSRASFNLYPSTPENFRKLSGPWRTALPLTTAYMVFMEPPVVAGHIFLRTETGRVVCYDLRKK